jgi:hypothetical protein
MALVGTGAAALVALLLIRYGWVTNWNPLPAFSAIGAAVGAGAGFWFSDYKWKRLRGMVLPFSNWP